MEGKGASGIKGSKPIEEKDYRIVRSTKRGKEQNYHVLFTTKVPAPIRPESKGDVISALQFIRGTIEELQKLKDRHLIYSIPWSDFSFKIRCLPEEFSVIRALYAEKVHNIPDCRVSKALISSRLDLVLKDYIGRFCNLQFILEVQKICTSRGADYGINNVSYTHVCDEDEKGFISAACQHCPDHVKGVVHVFHERRHNCKEKMLEASINIDFRFLLGSLDVNCKESKANIQKNLDSLKRFISDCVEAKNVVLQDAIIAKVRSRSVDEYGIIGYRLKDEIVHTDSRRLVPNIDATKMVNLKC